MSDARTKSFALCMKAAGDPTAAQLAAIRAYTLRDFKAEELVVREFVLAHNAIDRDNEVMDESLLADFARTIPGKGTYINHPASWRSDGGPAEGRVFGARLERMSFEVLREPGLKFPPDRAEATLLYTEAYFVRTPDNEALLLKMDAGIAGDVSIGFNAADIVPIRDAEGRELRAYRWVGPGEALEQSLVWLGALKDAGATKNASRETDVDKDTENKIKGLETDRDQHKAAAEKNAGAAALVAGIKSALGDNAALLDDAKGVASLITAGVQYRKSLVDGIVTAERHLKIGGDDEASVKTSRELYEAMATDRLEQMHKHLLARLPKGGTIEGGDPSKVAPGDPDNSNANDVTKAAPGPFGGSVLTR